MALCWGEQRFHFDQEFEMKIEKQQQQRKQRQKRKRKKEKQKKKIEHEESENQREKLKGMMLKKKVNQERRETILFESEKLCYLQLKVEQERIEIPSMH